MTPISAKSVMELRNRTGSAMMACKKALEASDGDFDKAIEYLRKRGEAKASEKSGRQTSEGTVVVQIQGNKAAIVGLRCETDFVARNEKFLSFANTFAEKALQEGAEAAKENTSLLSEGVSDMGENITLGDVFVREGAGFASYIHSNGKIGVVVIFEGSDQEAGSGIAMHIAAMNPSYTDASEVEDSLVEKEKTIWIEQLKSEGKPENIIENILKGKERKFREENALLSQSFVKDPSISIGEYAKQRGLTLLDFVRVEV